MNSKNARRLAAVSRVIDGLAGTPSEVRSQLMAPGGVNPSLSLYQQLINTGLAEVRHHEQVAVGRLMGAYRDQDVTVQGEYVDSTPLSESWPSDGSE